jgi:leucyl-tRNA synthetase
MRDLGEIGFGEPFARLLTQGMVLNHIFQRRNDKGGVTYFAPEEIAVEQDAAGRILGAKAKADGQPVEYTGIGTMSKSKRNGVDPQALIDELGADTARFFIIFTSPPEQTLEWSEAGVEGAHRFLRRVWAFSAEVAEAVRSESRARQGTCGGHDFSSLGRAHPQLAAIRREVHASLKQATFDIERHQFNTVASAAMKVFNALTGLPREGAEARAVLHEGLSILLRVLYPITPHIGHVLWQELGFASDPMSVAWPEVDVAALETDEVELVIQVNGKLRGHLRAPRAADKAAIEALALAHEAVAKHSQGQAPKKVVVVPGRLVNVVL